MGSTHIAPFGAIPGVEEDSNCRLPQAHQRAKVERFINRHE